ncbi:hypothetical protein SPRG_02349 [Saprolegnia parasitica CBS 223.65]|uniref:Receptor expression-enhancing protein n=1 Tax=Saprolegnia parasitica (strain CBS 223.65) TaxID=695850 RepID=A0A067CQ75_SAPPC|nr:hypothetical protein SPRG_02349 [Saprolegnia parasitica CBS 223.65]KDO32648.1 hypothetical protein SPRG_02349 [Saprolegnia parasitica CBS 223.65]|eukprot:XP_012196315.1 hypothetical protein SPRG_02349 [Saprolegnia parasitica CBS 223.65]
MEVLRQLRATLDEWDIAALNEAEEQLGVDKTYVFLGLIGAAYLVLVGGLGAGFLATTMGFLYPGYASFRVLQKPALVRKAETRLWLMYWIVFGCYKIAEGLVLDPLFSLVPNYNSFKLIGVSLLFVPSTRRTCMFYSRYLVPFLKPTEGAKFGVDCATSDVAETDLFQDIARFFTKKATAKPKSS